MEVASIPRKLDVLAEAILHLPEFVRSSGKQIPCLGAGVVEPVDHFVPFLGESLVNRVAVASITANHYAIGKSL